MLLDEGLSEVAGRRMLHQLFGTDASLLMVFDESDGEGRTRPRYSVQTNPLPPSNPTCTCRCDNSNTTPWTGPP